MGAANPVRSGTTLIKIVVAQRGTTLCPTCQRLDSFRTISASIPIYMRLFSSTFIFFDNHIRRQQMVKIGHAVPEFTMAAYHNNEIVDIKLSDYKGKWLVLLFYPADFTLSAPLNSKMPRKYTTSFKPSVQKSSASAPTHRSCIKRGTIIPMPLVKWRTRWEPIRQGR